MATLNKKGGIGKQKCIVTKRQQVLPYGTYGLLSQ